MTKKERISLIVFSLTVSNEQLASVIRTVRRKDRVVFCLSPHLPFDLERARIQFLAGREVRFISFYEFISQGEMEYCDVESDKIILQEYGTREGLAGEYFNKIKQLKNEVILKNISLKYDCEDKFILADDLGIDEDVWIKNGASRIHAVPKQEGIQKKSCLTRASGFFERRKKRGQISLMMAGCKKYYYFGKSDRVLQYLDTTKCMFMGLPSWELRYLAVLAKVAGLSRQTFRAGGVFGFIFTVLLFVFKRIKRGDIPDIISSIHAYNDAYGYLAARLNVQMICLQDGFLPGYYPSAYLKYMVWVNTYYIWDNLSSAIFERHALQYEVWSCFKKIKLPLIAVVPASIRKIVFLASGAGDWTALKNRSDEDLTFLAFVDAAKDNPGINFVYRPHPLWMHPAHQGVNSIQRVVDYAAEIKLPNLFVSGGALKDGNNFKRRGQLSDVPATINADLDSSDIVLGDHSQALVTAAQRGKIIASVNLAKRREFFSSYTQLGFPLLRSAKDITSFIKRVEGAPNFIAGYNHAIELYNNTFN